MTSAEPSEEYGPLPLTFDVPEEFREIDLTADPEDRANTLFEQLQAERLGLTNEQLLHALLTHQYLVDRMVTEGVVYAATVVGRSERDETALSAAQFTVTLQHNANMNSNVLDTIGHALQQDSGAIEAQYVDLPIGRCLSVLTDSSFSPPVDLLGRETDEARHIRQLQVIYPLQEQRQLVFFGISSEFLHDWDDYVELMAEICKTIRRPDAGKMSTLQARLKGE